MAHANARLTPAGRMILCQRIAAGRPVAHVAAEMGISRTCAYRWWARYREHGPAGLVDRPSWAHHHPRRTPAQLEAAVLELRRSRKLGPARIAPLVGLAASTVYRVLCRHRLNRLAWMDRPTGQLIRRHERAHPGELVHMDVKKLGRIPAGRPEPPRVQWRLSCVAPVGVGGQAHSGSRTRLVGDGHRRCAGGAG